MDVFILKLILTFIIGSLWVTYATIIAEKLGPKIGGLLAGIPSSTLISLFFIGWTQNADIAARSTTVIPVILGIDTLFVALYLRISRKHFLSGIAMSLIFWFFSSLIMVLFKFNNFFLSLLLSALFISGSYVYIEYVLKVKTQTAVKYKYSLQNLLFRGVLTGFIMTTAVVMAKIGGPILGGTFAAFPAVFLSTIIITHSAHGWSFSASVMKILMLSGAINVIVYAVAVRLFYPMFGLYIGTIFSFFISLISAYGVFQLIKKTS